MRRPRTTLAGGAALACLTAVVLAAAPAPALGGVFSGRAGVAGGSSLFVQAVVTDLAQLAPVAGAGRATYGSKQIALFCVEFDPRPASRRLYAAGIDADGVFTFLGIRDGAETGTQDLADVTFRTTPRAALALMMLSPCGGPEPISQVTSGNFAYLEL